MSGSKMTSTTLAEMRAAHALATSETDVFKLRANAPYVWDGEDEDDRPLTPAEMRSGMDEYRKRRNLSVRSDDEASTIRFDQDVLMAFRASGPGWQNRMNAALRDWLKTHSPA